LFEVRAGNGARHRRGSANGEQHAFARIENTVAMSIRMEWIVMFDFIIREVASKFGLGDKAGPLLQMLLGYMTNKDTGGLSGFMGMFDKAGLGGIAKSWLGGGSSAQAISTSQVEQLFGGSGGLLSTITSKLGIGGSAASGALSFLLPAVIGKLTPGGSIPTSLPSDVMGFIGGAKDMLGGGASALAGGATAATAAAKSGGGGLMKWLPWVIAAAVAAYVLSQCTGKPTTPAAPKVEPPKVEAPKPAAPAPVAATPAPAPAAAAVEVPTGAGVLTWVSNSMPALKVYFDTGKTDVHSDWAAKSGELVSFLKANAGAKAVISGFNDPTGNAAANAELSKNRAKAVAGALKAAGIEDGRVELRKPADTTAGAGASNAEARRVEVTIEK
jgi:outer membrane protein OmpA-like peptidoglycan-associated protein/uncharacterized protein YidB (DUF937 family)